MISFCFPKIICSGFCTSKNKGNRNVFYIENELLSEFDMNTNTIIMRKSFQSFSIWFIIHVKFNMFITKLVFDIIYNLVNLITDW